MYTKLCIPKKPHSAMKEGSDIVSRKVFIIMLLKIFTYCTVDLITLYMYLDNNCMHIEINDTVYLCLLMIYKCLNKLIYK